MKHSWMKKTNPEHLLCYFVIKSLTFVCAGLLLITSLSGEGGGGYGDCSSNYDDVYRALVTTLLNVLTKPGVM